MGLLDDYRGKLAAVGRVAMGAVLGLALVFLIGSSLIEISRNDIFSILYCVLLGALGLVMAWRVVTTAMDRRTKAFGLAVAALTAGSGVLAIVLDENLLKSLSPPAKVPMYLFLSITLSFTFLYALVEFVITTHHAATGSDATPDYASLAATFPLFAATAGFMGVGGFYGLMFGLLDVEDYDSSALHAVAYTLGVVSGGGVMLLHHTRQHAPSTWISVAQPSDSDDEDDAGEDAVPV